MSRSHEDWMRTALEDAAKSASAGNSAVGSLVIRDGEIIGRGGNEVNSTSDPTAHAEIVAIRNTGQTDLSGCTLYTTFEPCPMCCGAIMVSGVDVLVLGARHDPVARNFGDYSVERLIELSECGDRLSVVTGVLTKECADIRQ